MKEMSQCHRDTKNVAKEKKDNYLKYPFILSPITTILPFTYPLHQHFLVLLSWALWAGVWKGMVVWW